MIFVQRLSPTRAPPLCGETIEVFRAEEPEHRDIGLAPELEPTLGYRLLTAVSERVEEGRPGLGVVLAGGCD